MPIVTAHAPYYTTYTFILHPLLQRAGDKSRLTFSFHEVAIWDRPQDEVIAGRENPESRSNTTEAH